MSEPLQALKAGRDYEFWGSSAPKCPHCGHECGIERNDWFRLYEEGSHEVTCPECDRDFDVETRVSFTFSTDTQA